MFKMSPLYGEETNLLESLYNISQKVNVRLTGKGRWVLSQSAPVARKIVSRVMWWISENDTVLLEKPFGGLQA